MFGNNPIRRPVNGEGDTLEVQELFATIQGEGPYAGTPAVFIRLGGCNLACWFCDTEFESFKLAAVDKIIADVCDYANCDGRQNRINLIVITGGEPLRQPIEQLCTKLLAQGFKVQIETNGTLYRELDERVDWVCSPKPSVKGYLPIRPDVLKRLLAIKFLVAKDDAQYADIADVGQNIYNTPVYIQPIDKHEDAANVLNLDHARQLAMQYGYRLSVQLHKVMGVK